MGGNYDALDRVLLSFEEVDPVERVKEAMASGNHRAATAMIDRLNEDQLAKLAESFPGMETKDNSGTATAAESLDSSSEPKPENSEDSVVAGDSEPANAAGSEKTTNPAGDTSVANTINTDNGVPTNSEATAASAPEIVDAKTAAVRGIKRALRAAAEAALRKEANLRPTPEMIDAKINKLADLLLGKTK